MPIPQHVVISSNRWYSAATEYALRLCEHLHTQQGAAVEVVAQERSPLALRARSLGLMTRALPLRKSNGRALGPIGFFRMLTALRFAIEGWWRGGAGQPLVLWVVEGTEHSAVCLLRLLNPKWNKRIRVVRLRVQDPNRAGRVWTSWLEVIQAHATDLIVFPSAVASTRYFATRPKVAVAYGPRVFIQFFGKDSLPGMQLLPAGEHDQSAALARAHRLRAMLQTSTCGRVLLAVARFDLIKGLGELIEAFARLDQDCGPLTLVICGRSEGLSAADLAAEGARCLGGAMDPLEHGMWRIQAPSGLQQVIVVDGHVAEIGSILDLSFMAVVSSLGSEIICRTAVEFLQTGLPIVATSVGSLPEVLDAHHNSNAESACSWLVPVDKASDDRRSHRVLGLQATLQAALGALGPSKQALEYQARAQQARALGARYALSTFGSLVERVNALGPRDL